MEAEEATKPVSGATEETPSLSETSKAVEELIDDAKPAQQTNGTEHSEDDKKPEDANDNPKASKNEEPRQDQPSKRVQEGQRYNNRPRGDRNNNRPHLRRFDKKNIKSDLTSLQESSDPVAIRKQVEFYFSDSNLLQDKFLFTKVEGHKNLPVPIDVIHSFKRMRHFQPRSAIVDALKASESLNVVEDYQCVQRKEPLPEGLEGKPMVEIEKVYEDKSMARSIYAKGFGQEQPSTQFDIEAFFAQSGQTNSVRLRRHYDGTFKGSVFVEFNSEETQKAFLALDPKPKWQGEELLIKSKKQYCDDKVDDIAAGRVRPNEQDRSKYNKNDHASGKRHRDSPDYDRGVRREDDRDDRDWRTRREDDRKSGFKDRDGGRHKDSKRSGRGRDRGRRGGRGGRDRDRSRNRTQEKQDRDERGVPKIRTSTPGSGDEASPQSTTAAETPVKDKVTSKPSDDAPTAIVNGEKTLNQSMTDAPATAGSNEDAPSPTKKRAREDDDETPAEKPAKKVDVKTIENSEKTLNQTMTDTPATAGSNEDAPSSTKKRVREEDDETPAEKPAKKVDVKDVES